MRKKIIYIIFMFISLVSFNIKAKASVEGYISCSVVTDSLNLRDSVDGNIVSSLSCGHDIEILDDSLGKSSLCDNWYKIKYNNTEYYACGSYISKKEQLSQLDVEEYKKYLKELGFPESYLDSLVEIHKKHPNWQFRIFDTNLDWNTVIENESIKNRSLIYYTFEEGYRSLEPYSYDWEKDTFYRHPTEKNWYYASSDAVAYYMDPRNFLNEQSIFMFEALSYQPTFQTDTLVGKMLDNSFMPATYARYFDTSYTTAFLDGANTHKISPVHLASRILQENGIDGSISSSGTFTYNGVTYNDIFNFYNIGATGTDPAIQGLIWAMGGINGTATDYGRPWNDPYKSIVGGAEFLSKGYISVGQDTLYFQKFDVSTTNGHYNHQYMQNISAPHSEASSTFSAYSKISGLLDESLVFVIPIYDNMPKTKVNAPKNGNPNYYLKELKIDGNVVENFAYDKKDYTYYTKSNEVEITAKAINSKAKIKGIGKITLKDNENLLSVAVTAENGSKFTYNIKVIKEKEEEMVPEISLNEVLSSSGIKYNDEFLYGINTNTNVNSLIENIKNINRDSIVEIKDKDGKSKIDKIFVTGDTVTVTQNEESLTFNVVIYGDINGDGIIDKLDYLQVLRYYYNYSSLDGAYKEAADANKDGVVDKLDYLAVLRDYYGYSKIEQ